MTQIKFYRSSEKPYGVFSNFLQHYPIALKGKSWPSTEHYFQAQKFVGIPHEEAVRRVATPRDAADMGRDKSRPLRADWEHVKNEVMYEAIQAKFTQYPELGEILLQTGDVELIEHTVNDSYWADGGDGSGQNWLGKLLMQLRLAMKIAKSCDEVRKRVSEYSQEQKAALYEGAMKIVNAGGLDRK